jgi:hypothetical protein
MLHNVHLVAISSNSKIGPMPATYRGRETCPTDCAFLNNGCYGDGRIFALAHKYVRALSIDKAREILRRAKTDAKYLRDRVVGDLVNSRGLFDMNYVRGIARLAREHGLTVFGYTHAWRILTREDAAAIRATGYVMNASCETVQDVRHAISLGMPSVITNDKIVEGATVAGYRVITCPAQIRDNVTCATCGLCAKPDRKVIIRFLTHGPSKKRARAAIEEREAH